MAWYEAKVSYNNATFFFPTEKETAEEACEEYYEKMDSVDIFLIAGIPNAVEVHCVDKEYTLLDKIDLEEAAEIYFHRKFGTLFDYG